MRQLLLGLLFLGTISCLTNKKTMRDFTFHVDSAFVESFSTKDLQEISNISNFKIKEDQSFSFYDFQTQNLLDTIDIKIVLAKPKYPIVYDGELKIVYLMTVGRSGKQIDVLRVGKTEGIPGFSVLETSLIENDLVKRKFKESTLNDETVDVIRKLRSETFKITKEGKIKLQPT
jgi:hypothetical protein